MSYIIFYLIFISVFGFQTYIIKTRLINKFEFSIKTKKYLSIFLYITLLGIFIYPFARYYPVVPNWIYFLLSLPIGVIFITFILTIIKEIISLGFVKTNFTETRRNFFKKSLDITAVGVIASTNAKAINNARDIELEHVNIKLDKLNKSYTIAQLSDIHIGGLINANFIADLVERVNTLKADIIVITGDLVDTKLNFAQKALDELKNLKATYGVYFIVGNHEYFHGVKPIIDYVNSLGIKVLENQSVYIGKENQGFNLCGVYDRFGDSFGDFKPDINKALKDIKNSPTILLAHQPKYLEELKDTSKIDLVLSGHTHGGQIFPFNFLVKLQQPYVKGLHQHNNTTQIYINKGTGFWGPPMRLGASSEITFIKLS